MNRRWRPSIAFTSPSPSPPQGARAARPAARALLLLCLAAVALSAPGGCKTSQRISARPPPAPADTAAAQVKVAVDGGRSVAFRVELARSSAEREQGLMYRERMAPDAGMLFLFERPAPLTFWMKNTFIPLDMIFIGSDHRIAGIVENAEPRTLSSRRVEGLSQYVLEINGGLSARLGIRPGATVDFTGVPAEP